MQPRGIIAYIQTEKSVNTAKQKIVEHLLLAGYRQEDIDKAFKDLENNPEIAEAGVFADFVPNPSPRRRIFQWLTIFIVLNIIAFAIFSFLYNSITPIDDVPLVEFATSSITINSPIALPATITVVTPKSIAPQSVSRPVIVTPNPTPPSSGTNQYSENQVINAILTQGSTLQSGNASNIRNYLEMTASPQYKQQLSSMSDSDILSLASSMTSGQSAITQSSLSSPQAIWQQPDAVTVKVTIQTTTGPITRTAQEVNGVWY